MGQQNQGGLGISAVVLDREVVCAWSPHDVCTVTTAGSKFVNDGVSLWQECPDSTLPVTQSMLGLHFFKNAAWLDADPRSGDLTLCLSIMGDLKFRGLTRFYQIPPPSNQTAAATCCFSWCPSWVTVCNDWIQDITFANPVLHTSLA